jgi:hypothetical protein
VSWPRSAGGGKGVRPKLERIWIEAERDHDALRQARNEAARSIGTEFVQFALTCRILQIGETHMRWILAAACAAAISLAFAPGANAKGCIKGAVVGGVAGHMAGHGKLGAAAGCVVGHHEANKEDANRANAQAPSSHQAPSDQK